MATVQMRLPWSRDDEPIRPGRPARRSHSLMVAGAALPVAVVRHRRARRYVVRVTPEGTVRLTVPRGATIAGGLRFAAQQVAWIAREHARQLERAAPWSTGTAIWFRGERAVLIRDDVDVICGTERIRLGRTADVRAAVERRLHALALAELPPRLLELAAQVGLRVSRVSVRNQRSRWGACSSRGVITLNWRLVQMPREVSDYVLLHELMHLRQPNHSRRFWREVAAVCPWWREAERWLRRYGREIL
jgi:predicted metal-dependent hydrolase